MVKRSSIKREHDFTVTTFRIVQEAKERIDEPEPEPERTIHQPPLSKNPHAVALGALGGKKGGPARAMRLTAAQRSEIARKAAEVRWRKKQ